MSQSADLVLLGYVNCVETREYQGKVYRTAFVRTDTPRGYVVEVSIPDGVPIPPESAAVTMDVVARAWKRNDGASLSLTCQRWERNDIG